MSKRDYESTAARETYSARSDKKITHEFVGEMKTMIDYHPSKSIRAMANDKGVPAFLVMQTVHDHITRDILPPNSQDCNPLDYCV